MLYLFCRRLESYRSSSGTQTDRRGAPSLMLFKGGGFWFISCPQATVRQRTLGRVADPSSSAGMKQAGQSDYAADFFFPDWRS
jgi:hypothetical protein